MTTSPIYNGWPQYSNITGPYIVLSSGATTLPADLFSSTTATAGLGPHWAQWYYPNVSTTPTLTLTSFASTFKNIYKAQFIAFVKWQLLGKCLIFEDKEMGKKVVNKTEALKFAWLYFCLPLATSPAYNDYKEIFFKDSEWHVYFKEAETSEEYIQSIDFTEVQIEEQFLI